MQELDEPVRDALDALAPRYDDPGDWEAVVRDARAVERRGRRARTGLVAVAVLAAAVLGLAAPFESERGGILDRARAAVGDGPVLHAVLREGWGGTLVDLQTGERRPLHAEREVWYDRERGLHTVSRLGGVVEGEAFFDRYSMPPYERQTFDAIVSGYERAVGSGDARVLGPGEVDGIRVYWIRVHEEFHRDVADNRSHEWAHDVAVSRETFEPVAMRETLDGNVSPDGVTRILRLETLPAGAGDFSAPQRDDGATTAMRYGLGYDDPLTLAETPLVLGRTPLWPGPSVLGVPFARAWKFELAVGYSRETGRWRDEVVGVNFFYGALDEEGLPKALRGEHVSVKEVVGPHEAFRTGSRNYVPPEGTVRLTGRSGFLQRDGVYVTIEASSEELVVAAARALGPLPPSAGSGDGR